MILTGQKLEEFGKAVWGDDWIAFVSKRLRLSRKTLARYRDGDRGMPPDFIAEFDALIEHQLSITGRIYDERCGQEDSIA